jgi:hypothetical protein
MGAKLKMQEDWPSPTWASQRAWLPNIWFGGVYTYTDIIGPWRMDYSYPVKEAEPYMIRNFKSPWTGVSVTSFVFVNKYPEPYQPGQSRDVYISGVIYDPQSIQYDEEGNMLPPGGYVAWNRLAADLNHLKELVGKLTVRTRWYDEYAGTFRFVDTVVTDKSINNNTDTTPFQPTGDFVTTAGPNEFGQFWDFTIASS